MWGFHDKLNMWLVKRKIGNPEYYKDIHYFCSWTKVDLTELSEAPFHNPSKDPQGTDFKLFLENQVKRKFDGMKTAESFVKRDKNVLDPRTNEPMKIVTWPPTKQMKEIPIIQHFHDGSLENMEYWVFDEATSTAVIKFPNGVHRLVEAKDLLKFGERDIHTLSRHQIICKQELLEAAAKEFTGMIVEIISKKMWLGAMGRSDMMLIEKD